MKLTRILVLLLALTMALCVFAGCVEDEETTDGEIASSAANSTSSAADSTSSTAQDDTDTGEGYLVPAKLVATICPSDGGEQITYIAAYSIVTDGDNAFVTVTFEPPFESCSKFEAVFDKSGNRTKCVHYDENGNVHSHEEYEYDANGNKTKYVCYKADGSIYIHTEYEYDENGNETKSVSYDKDGNISGRTEYERDANGNMTKSVDYDKDGGSYSKKWTVNQRKSSA